MHFRQADEPLAVFEALAGDWVQAFIEFDVEIVADAAREWLWTQKWKPAVAELRELCERFQVKRERALLAPASAAGVPAWFAADKETQRNWLHPEDNGDIRLAYERRCAAFAAQEKKEPRRDELAFEGRATCNEWARANGYPDFDAAERDGRRYSEVMRWNSARHPPMRRMPLEPGEKPMPAHVAERERRRAEARAMALDFSGLDSAIDRMLEPPPLVLDEAAE